MDSERQAWAAIAGAILALLLLLAQGSQSQDALRQNNRLAWDYDGAEQCNNYRAQVLALWNLGLSEQAIIEWFRHENGSENNPFGDGDDDTDDTYGKNAYEDFAAGCGSVGELLVSLRGATPEAVRDAASVPR